MILARQDIHARALYGGMITPFSERTLHPETGMSYGLSVSSYDVRLDAAIHIRPQEFLLASTIERFNMPLDLAATVRDKSTLVRRGLTVQNTHVDAGWRGYLTLELINHSKVAIFLPAGAPIAQVVFEMLSQPVEQGYTGKYQDQERGPQPAREEQTTGSQKPIPSKCASTQ